MKTINNNIGKRVYQHPSIECIKLDNEISLILASDPPYGPGEDNNFNPEFYEENPY